MKKDESELIWEAYTSPGRVGGGNIPFPDGRGEMENHEGTKELDEDGREYIYKAPKRGHESEEEMLQVLKQLPQNMGELFKPDREGSFYVLTPSDKFESFSSDGDGMGDTIEHDLGYALVGLEDGHFLEYIKYPPMEKEDPDADLFRQSVNDYKRSEGLRP